LGFLAHVARGGLSLPTLQEEDNRIGSPNKEDPGLTYPDSNKEKEQNMLSLNSKIACKGLASVDKKTIYHKSM
jgi:hypothetical protein